MSMISYQLSAISYQLSAISYQLSAISYQLSAISYQLSAIRHNLTLKTFQNIFIFIALAVFTFAGAAHAASTFSGSGTQAAPYLISTVDDWKALANAVNGGTNYSGNYFKQTANLDMSGAGTLAPVGTMTAPFAGNYDGGGFAISNATINGVTTDGSTVAGVFGVLTGKGSISNLIVEKATVTATKGSGGWDMAFAGGLVAVVEDAAITDCSVSDSRVTAGGGSDTFSGAVVGYAQSNNGEVTTISQIASKNNTVVGGGYGGGVLGSFYNEATLSMTNCYAVGSNVSAQTYSQASIGAFLGASQGGGISLTNCFVYGCSEDTTSSSGGKAGLFAGETDNGTVTATNTYYYDTHNLSVNATSATSKTADEMKSLASTLGEPFTQGADYPILLHSITITVSIDGWTYGETANEPSVTGNIGNGTVTYQYKLKNAEDTTYSETVPTDVGDYTLKAIVAATTTHKAAEATADFTIAKANAVVTAAPAANNLTFSGEAQALVTAGSASGGVMQYSLDNTNWSTEIPTAVNVGTYTVYYKVIGDANHNDTEAQSVSVEIKSKPNPAPTPEPEPEPEQNPEPTPESEQKSIVIGTEISADAASISDYLEGKTEEQLQSVTELKAENMSSLTDLSGIEKLTNLETLNIKNAENLTDISAVKELKNLKTIDVSGCTALGNANLSGMKNLTEVSANRCESLSKLDVKGCDNLKKVDISGCKSLENADLSSLQNLTEVSAKGCESLSELDVSNCESLTSLDCSESGIDTLKADGCVKLANLDCHENSLTQLDADKNSLPNLNSLICYGQMRYNIKIDASSTGYALDLQQYVSEKSLSASKIFSAVKTSSLSKVLSVKAYDANGKELAASFDEITGVITFNSRPHLITYDYNTGFISSESADVLMDVALYMTDEQEDTPVTNETSSHGSSSGCNVNNFGLLALALALAKRCRRK